MTIIFANPPQFQGISKSKMKKKNQNKRINANKVYNTKNVAVDVCLENVAGTQFYNYSLAHK